MNLEDKTYAWGQFFQKGVHDKNYKELKFDACQDFLREDTDSEREKIDDELGAKVPGVKRVYSASQKEKKKKAKAMARKRRGMMKVVYNASISLIL